MKQKHILCVLLAFSLAFPSGIVLGAEPTVSVDEAVYVNLDYYGARSDVSIVKSCNLNTIRQFTDYGAYASVTNMSNLALPAITDTGVKWDLSSIEMDSEKNPERFYFECKLKDNTQLILPWTFDVSYKCNGVPAKAEDLAGAAGLIEINIHAIPNENANEYSKNNMLLQVAMMVDMDETLSVEAPGSQLQSLGTYKAIVFAALPGEDTTFTIRLGTDSFETTGITMMMIPGTLSQIQDIKDLKESKDKVEDAANAIKDSMDDIIGTMESMSGGLKATQSGLRTLDESRAQINEEKESVYESSDQAIFDLTNLTDNISSLIPHLKNGQSMVTDLNKDLNNMSDILTDTKDSLKEYRTSITKMQTAVMQLQDLIDDADAKQSRRKEIFDALSDSLDSMTGSLGRLQRNTQALGNEMSDAKSSTQSLTSVMELLSQNPLMDKVLEESLSESLTPEEWEAYKAGLGFAGSQAGQTSAAISSAMGQTSHTLQALENTLDNGDDLTANLKNLLDITGSYLDLAESGNNSTQALLTQANAIGKTTKEVLNLAQSMINETNALTDTMNQYEPDIQNLLEDSQKLAEQLNTSLLSTLDFLTSFQAMLRNTGDTLNAGTQQTLNGMVDIMSQALIGITKTGNIKNANQLVKDTIDNELDRFEEDTNLLNMDSDQPKISFTSAQNPEPESIQVLLRTDEISIDDDETEEDLENSAEDIGITGRIKNVFSSIWEKLKGIFK